MSLEQPHQLMNVVLVHVNAVWSPTVDVPEGAVNDDQVWIRFGFLL